MRVPVFPIVASLALLAAPAFAQNGATTNSDQNAGYNSSGVTGSMNRGMSGYSNSGTNTYSGTIGTYNQQYQPNDQNPANQQNAAAGYSNAGYSNDWQNRGDVTSDTKDRIRQSLMQSGFHDVTVTPQAFVIHAQAPDGSHVVMLLRSDMVTGVIAQTGSSSGYSNNHKNSNSWNNGSSGASNMNNWSNGSSNTESGSNH